MSALGTYKFAVCRNFIRAFRLTKTEIQRQTTPGTTSFQATTFFSATCLQLF
jgi:hypothetical protein